MRANEQTVPISRRRAVLRAAILEMEEELDREERAAAMRLPPPRRVPAQGFYPEPLRRQA